MPATQYRACCFTTFNIGKPEVLLGANVRYIIFQEEKCPESGKHHYQGYSQFHRRMTLKSIKDMFQDQEMHIENPKGSPAQNITYCSKKESQVAGPWEAGQRPKQGERTDLQAVADDIKAGATLKDIREKHPVMFIKFNKGIKELIAPIADETPRRWKTEVIVLQGSTNTGKSSYVDYYYPDRYVDNLEKGKFWFDGYHGQDVVLFDDFDTNTMTRSQFLKLTDRYPMQVPIKHGFVNWKPRKIFFTTNEDATTWYGGDPAVRRRFTQIIDMDAAPFVHPDRAVPDPPQGGADRFTRDDWKE